MRLSVVGPFYPYRGGIAHFGEALVKALRERGHDVDPVTFSRQYPALLFPGRTQFEAGAAEAGEARRLLDTVGPASWGRTAQAISKHPPDAALFQFWMPFLGPSYGSVARLLQRHSIPSLTLVHNALPHERRPGDRALARYFLNTCAGHLVMSDSVRRDLGTLGIDASIHQVRHPAVERFGEAVPRDEARVALGLPADAPVLLFFGFVRHYKGLHVLLDAMPSVLGRIPDARLVVAGEFYDDEAPYRARAELLGDAVRFDADYIPNEHVGLYFSAADVVVQPYVSATQSGVAQLAFQFGRPVITTDVGGLAEAVPDGEAGLVVPPEDAGSLASAIVRFFDDDLAERLEAGVRRERVAYGWDPLLDAVEDLANRAQP